VDPAEAVYAEQVAASGDPHFHPPVMEDLKAEARGARFEIAAIKVVAARLATTVIDRAIQAFGAAGVSDDWPLASMHTRAHPAPGRRSRRGAPAADRRARAARRRLVPDHMRCRGAVPGGRDGAAESTIDSMRCSGVDHRQHERSGTDH
jgi:Acyl-CoA dehydrogenase, C-terminal domain